MVSILKSKRFFPVYWLVLASLLLWADFLTGPFLGFPVFFIFPVALASWYSGRNWGLFLSLLVSSSRLYFAYEWEEAIIIHYAIVNFVIRLSVFSIFAILVDLASKQKREIEILHGLLPICASCKKIRDKNEEWQAIEAYVSQRSKAEFTHTVCPECVKKLYPQVAEKAKLRDSM